MGDAALRRQMGEAGTEVRAVRVLTSRVMVEALEKVYAEAPANRRDSLRVTASRTISLMASILVFGPHPDDQELGMGGTIVRTSPRRGTSVHLVDMTNGEPTPHGSSEIRARESAAAAEMLGVGRTLLGLTNREVRHTTRVPPQAGRA